MKISGKSGECAVTVGDSISSLKGYFKADKAVVITDSKVRKLHGGSFPRYPVIEIGQGEESKTLETVKDIYLQFMELGLDRSSFVIGIGGGIVCDVAGFAANTYMRGIPFGFAPTTLVAQSDAALGGKNGVNLLGYKNLVGTFCQPKFVLCDTGALSTLPSRELSCGISEIIKHAAIADGDFFSYLESHVGEVIGLKRTAIEKAVCDSISIKAKIVEADETEKGARMKLNFGHTIGHAVEKAAGLPHGEAVSIGMAAEAALSVKLGLLAKKDEQRLRGLIAKAGLPLELPQDGGVGKGALIDAVMKDKKKKSDVIRIVVLESIGKSAIREIRITELEGILDDLCKHI